MTAFNEGKGVLIVGAGPTGLTLANACAAYGVPFTVIDQKPSFSRHSKGIAINMASRTRLDAIGVQGLGTRAQSVDRVTVFWRDKRFTRIDLSRLPCEMKPMAIQPQSLTEQELADALSKAGHNVTWDTRLVSITQREGHVAAVLVDISGRQQTWDCDLVIGCEGKHSIVRDEIGGSMAGSDYGVHIVLGDFRLSDPPASSEATYHVSEEGFVVLVPIGGGIWRVVVSNNTPVADHPAARCLAVSQALHRILGRHMELSEPQWLSSLPLYMRVSTRLRSGRLLIAGDAAHLFPPIGGLGMNTGIGDATDLAWRLAMIHHHGGDSELLLGEYEQCRLRQIQSASSQIDALTRLICRTIDDHPIQRLMAPILANRSAWRVALPAQFAGLSPSAVSTSGPIEGDVFWPMPWLRKHLLGMKHIREVVSRGAIVWLIKPDWQGGDAIRKVRWLEIALLARAYAGKLILAIVSGSTCKATQAVSALRPTFSDVGNVAWLDVPVELHLDYLLCHTQWILTPDGQVIMRAGLSTINPVSDCLGTMGLVPKPVSTEPPKEGVVTFHKSENISA